MTPSQVKMLVQSKNPCNQSRHCYSLQYGDEIGGTISTDVRIVGDVYIPIGSWVSGKCILRNVRIPYNTCIISLSVHDKHVSANQIGDFRLVKDFRVRRGLYVSGLIRIEEHEELRAKVIIGYELVVFGRLECSDKVYKKIQKKKR